MPERKLNVLVYSGNGTEPHSVQQCLASLRHVLTPHYAVSPITAKALAEEPWGSSCKLLVCLAGIAGGCVSALGGARERIERFVRGGGCYLGIGGGGGYGVGQEGSLGVYPGRFVASGSGDDVVAAVTVDQDAFGSGAPADFEVPYGDGFSIETAKNDAGVEVLARYARNIPHAETSVAGVYCRAGEGRVVLSGPRLEKCPDSKSADGATAVADIARMEFLKACLIKLGLQTSESADVLSISPIHLSSTTPSGLQDIVSKLQAESTQQDGDILLKDANDSFRLIDSDPSQPNKTQSSNTSTDIIIHKQPPPPTTTPYFNHETFYSSLKEHQSQSPNTTTFGSTLLYGDVITSTNTILEKNIRLLQSLPTGSTATATTQISGRGRGSNVWVCPRGSLLFSTVLRYPIEKAQSAPISFIQHLAGMAVVRGIKQYAPGYENLPIKLKWPNDIYALDPTSNQYTKISGILVNCTYTSNSYTFIVGPGINVTNASPTTSLSTLVSHYLPATTTPLSLEKLLASILTSLEEIYTHFLSSGFDLQLERMYYEDWLHSNQIVVLEEGGGVRARIQGITRDFGLLVAEEVDGLDRGTGVKWELQSDNNSFDFFRGLIRRKI